MRKGRTVSLNQSDCDKIKPFLEMTSFPYLRLTVRFEYGNIRTE